MSIIDSKTRFENELSNLSDSNARKRLAMLFDNGTYTEIDRFLKSHDNECEVVAAFGEVNGMPVYAYAQSIDVNSGAMGKAQAAKITHVYELATKTGAPVVAVFDSNGAYISEGVEALEAYGSVIKAAGNISGVVPQVSVVAGPCIGSAAVLASLSDLVIMTKDAEFYITAPSFADNKETTLGTAQLAAENGTAALVVDTDKDAMEKAAELLAYMPSNNLSEALMADFAPATGVKGVDAVVDSESFFEISPEYGKCIKTGFARIGGVSVGVVATDPAEKDGYFCACGARKAAKFIRLCDSFSIPVVTLVDSKGILAKEQCDLAGGVKSVSILTSAYSEATTAKITVVCGNAFAGAYIAFVSSAASPDFVFATSDAVIGALEPMTAVQMMYKERLLAGEDRAALEAEYISNECSPFCAAAIGLVSDVVDASELSYKLATALDTLASKRVTTLNKKHNNIPL